MSSIPVPSATPPKTSELTTGAVIRRLLRDYISGEWGLLVAGDLLHADRLGHHLRCFRNW